MPGITALATSFPERAAARQLADDFEALNLRRMNVDIVTQGGPPARAVDLEQKGMAALRDMATTAGSKTARAVASEVAQACEKLPLTRYRAMAVGTVMRAAFASIGQGYTDDSHPSEAMAKISSDVLYANIISCTPTEYDPVALVLVSAISNLAQPEVQLKAAAAVSRYQTLAAPHQSWTDRNDAVGELEKFITSAQG